jgi:DNA-directed RNA polymerase subunit RPC12/RpoP
MSIYTCPHCGAKSFNPLTKALAGTMKSKGRACPKCGMLCVNGKSATIFQAIFSVVAFIAVGYIYLHGADNEWMFTHEVPMVFGLILSTIFVPKIVNAFFFKMEQSIRIDAYK